ncbi:MAG: hypothetical protein PPP56_02945 [Longimonas sp.]|uniref:hypothetical protein n=1 Tax=Longimonas sp. TaxID=2039626 RepID=UPI00334C892D
MTVSESALSPWWRDYSVPLGHMAHWAIGSLSFWAMRTEREWRVAQHAGQDPLADANTYESLTPDAESAFNWDEPEQHTVQRFSMKETSERCALHPQLADRPVVIRPEHPISIVSGETITLFVSTPLWIQYTVHAPAVKLLQMPTMRPSDTWFGTNTRQGELCYASRTTGRLQLSEVPVRPHRAITPLRIRNRASDTLLLERVQVPTAYLALYENEAHALWTQALRLDRGPDNISSSTPAAQVHIEPGTPDEAGSCTRIAEPRETSKRNLFISTFSAVGSLFGS